jgi:hypothetical protein
MFLIKTPTNNKLQRQKAKLHQLDASNILQIRILDGVLLYKSPNIDEPNPQLEI